ncbi:MAG: hypothetical protein ABIP92_05055 [Arthrobacter sp.]
MINPATLPPTEPAGVGRACDPVTRQLRGIFRGCKSSVLVHVSLFVASLYRNGQMFGERVWGIGECFPGCDDDAAAEHEAGDARTTTSR